MNHSRKFRRPATTSTSPVYRTVSEPQPQVQPELAPETQPSLGCQWVSGAIVAVPRIDAPGEAASQSEGPPGHWPALPVTDSQAPGADRHAAAACQALLAGC